MKIFQKLQTTARRDFLSCEEKETLYLSHVTDHAVFCSAFEGEANIILLWSNIKFRNL